MLITIDITTESWASSSKIEGEIKKNDLAISFILYLRTPSSYWNLYVTNRDLKYTKIQSFPLFKRQDYVNKKVIKWMGENHNIFFLIHKSLARKT